MDNLFKTGILCMLLYQPISAGTNTYKPITHVKKDSTNITKILSSIPLYKNLDIFFRNYNCIKKEFKNFGIELRLEQNIIYDMGRKYLDYKNSSIGINCTMRIRKNPF